MVSRIDWRCMVGQAGRMGKGRSGYQTVYARMRRRPNRPTDTREFVAAARVALEVAAQLDDNDPVKGLFYNALDDSLQSA